MSPFSARYSRWDGTQGHPELRPDEVVDALSDDLLQHGDLTRALRSLLQRGFQTRSGYQQPGLHDLRMQLQRQKRDLLSQNRFDRVYDELKQKLAELVQQERATVGDRLAAADDPHAEAPPELRDALRRLAQRNQDALNALPPDPAGAIERLRDYEFLDPEAGASFQELLQTLQGNLLDAFFQDLQRQLGAMGPDQLERMRQMTADLNELLEARQRGEPVDFDQFRQRHADLLPNAPDNLDDFLQQMYQQMQVTQSLLNSLSDDQREGLLDLLGSQLFDNGLQDELGRLAGNLRQMSPFALSGREYRFFGTEDASLGQALGMVRRLHDIETLDHQMEQARYSGNMQEVDQDLAEEVLGPEAKDALDHIGSLRKLLEESGMVDREGSELRLTGRAARSIGQRALADIFADLKMRGAGGHTVQSRGVGMEPAPETKPYEFGDAFHLDLRQTVMNAVARGGGSPVGLRAEDFEVHTTERVASAVTVVLLDVSRSMPMRGNFVAAKKVAMALSTLIRTQFPRDTMYVVGFSGIAREISQDELPYVNVGDFGRGTNMQGALRIARRLLGKHPQADRQVVMVTDGEPSAFYNALGQVVVEYPPGPQVLYETMREVRQCTKQGVVINTFMLEGSGRLRGFVTELARANRGRVLFTSPDHLGRYVMTDFLNSRKRTAKRT